VCNGQKTFDDCDDSELCQILSAAFRGTAKECWAQYIGDAIRVELMQDADLFEPSGDLKQSVERLRNMAKEDGTTVTISAGGRSVTL